MTNDLVKRLNQDFSANAREDIQHQMKVYEKERKEAADRIEKLETAFEELIKAWEFWQNQEIKTGFTELCAAYWEAKATLEGNKKNGS